MIDSDYDYSQVFIHDYSISTAESVHHSCYDYDQEMASIHHILTKFIEKKLMITVKFDDLQQKLFKQNYHTVLPPVPSLYFLPYHILLFDKNIKLDQVRNQIYTLNDNYSASLFLFEPVQYLFVKLHNKTEMIYYNIRKIGIPQQLHKKRQFLDQRYLIDKLYQYYCQYYKSLYFEQTSILILFWAHQKILLDDQINQHSLKLIVICIFINFGYGVPNIVYQHLNNQQNINEQNKMYSYAHINQEGNTSIDQQFIDKYQNYTIQEKNGFYMPSLQRTINIKDIVPISFPILPLNQHQHKQQQKQAEKNTSIILRHGKENISICKNIYRIFKFLHNKFNKKIKLTINFEQILAYTQEQSQHLQLEIMHPVLGKRFCKIKDYTIRNFRAEISNIYTGFKKRREPLDIIKQMLDKCKKTRG